MLKQFWKDENGASAAEYALILAVVGPGLGAAALVLGANVGQSGSSLESDLDATNAYAAASPSNNGGGQVNSGSTTTGGGTTTGGSTTTGGGTDTGGGTNTGGNPPTNPGGQSCNPKAKKCG